MPPPQVILLSLRIIPKKKAVIVVSQSRPFLLAIQQSNDLVTYGGGGWDYARDSASSIASNRWRQPSEKRARPLLSTKASGLPASSA